MKFEDVRTLWPLLGALVMLSGFYYTTQLRLDQLEADVITLQNRAMMIEGREKKIEQDLRKLRKHNNSRKKK